MIVDIFEIAAAVFAVLVILGTFFSLLWGAECLAVRIFPSLAGRLPGHLQPRANGKRNNQTAHDGAVEGSCGAVDEGW